MPLETDPPRRFILAQLICLAGAFFIAWVGGETLSYRYGQTRFLADDLLGGKPLPWLTMFFMENRYLVAHLTMIPWFCLVIIPLCGKRNFFDFPAFTARLAVFWTVETLLFAFLFLGLVLPFLPHYGVIEPYAPTVLDTAGKVSVWLLGGLAIAGLTRRLWMPRKS